MSHNYNDICLDAALLAAQEGQDHGSAVAEGAVIGFNAVAHALNVVAPIPPPAKAFIGSALGSLAPHEYAWTHEHGPEYVGALAAAVTYGICVDGQMEHDRLALYEDMWGSATSDTAQGSPWQQPGSGPVDQQAAHSTSASSGPTSGSVNWSAILGGGDAGSAFSTAPGPDASVPANGGGSGMNWSAILDGGTGSTAAAADSNSGSSLTNSAASGSSGSSTSSASHDSGGGSSGHSGSSGSGGI